MASWLSEDKHEEQTACRVNELQPCVTDLVSLFFCNKSIAFQGLKLPERCITSYKIFAGLTVLHGFLHFQVIS